MLAKILAALAVPVIIVVLVGAILRATHHTTIPPLTISVTPAAHSSTAKHAAATQGQLNACYGPVSTPFAAIAVQHKPATALATYKEAFSAKPQIVEFYNAFKKPFGYTEAWQTVENGQIPFIQLNPRGVSLQQIANGAWDRHLRIYAKAVKAFGCKLILSFAHEMNGWWYSWGAPRTTPAEFIAAWRHIHDIFTNAGANNVIWSWDPSHQYGPVATGKSATAASDWYPGDAYVNWIGLDGYLGYNRNGHAQNFRQIFSFQLQNVRKHSHGKPVFIAETGVVRGGPAVASQIAELFAGVRKYHLMGLVWFDAKSTRHDYRLGKYRGVDTAFKAGLTTFVKK